MPRRPAVLQIRPVPPKRTVVRLECVARQSGRLKGTERDLIFMREALEQARIAYDKGEVPIGAVLVCGNVIVSRQHNQTETLSDPTAHAEMLCIRDATAKHSNWRLSEFELFTTLEPCPMCAGAILQSRISRCVYGAKSPLLGAAGSWIDLLGPCCGHPFHPHTQVVHGICAHEASALLKSFYQGRRIRN